jgi:transposase
MVKHNGVFVGCDLGDKFTELAVLDDKGAVVETARIKTTRASFVHHLGKYKRSRVVLEAGVHSRWVAEVLCSLGHEVIVANPRQVRLIWKRRMKTDRTDAMVLARLGRFDVSLLAPVQHRSRGAQVDLAAVRSRDLLVGIRTKLLNHVRGTLKQFGVVLPSCHAGTYPRKVDAILPGELRPALGPALSLVGIINDVIAAYDKQVTELATTVYSETARMSQINGVGELTALAFALTLENPSRFKKSRFAPAFLGLTPAKEQSGSIDPQKHITKAGNPLVRKYLVQCAQHMLGHTGHDSDLRRWGLQLAARGGKNGKKRAVVAVARKLAVLMHRLWISGEHYQPLGYSTKSAATA